MLIKVQMPSQGDMNLVSQEGGALTLEPIYYGNECMGPFIEVLDTTGKTPKVAGRYRLCIKQDGKVVLRSGTTTGEPE